MLLPPLPPPVAWLAFAGAVQGAMVAPRETTKAEEVKKASTGVSPVVTPRPGLSGMELFRRDDTPMGFNTCGWLLDYNSLSEVCEKIGASCINIGSIRGCCAGPTLSCTSTFWTRCLPYDSIPNGFICSGRTLCCMSTEYPECGAYVFTPDAAPESSYTMHGCFRPNFGVTHPMGEHQPNTIVDPPTTPISPTTTSLPPIITTSLPPVTDPSTPVGPIVGGVVGGLGVVALLILGIVWIRRRRPVRTSPSLAPGQAPPPPVDYAYQSPPYSGNINNFNKNSPYSLTETSPTFSSHSQFPPVSPTQFEPNQHGITASQGPPQPPPQMQGLAPGPMPGPGPMPHAPPGNTPSPNPSTNEPYANPTSHAAGGLTRASPPQTTASMPNQDPILNEGAFVITSDDYYPNPNPPPAATTGSPNSAEVGATYPRGTRNNRAELSGSVRRGEGVRG